MKLATLISLTLLAGVAHADDRTPVDPYAPHLSGPRAATQRPRLTKQQRQALRRAIVQHFDQNGDGRLQPDERRQAARVLRRVAIKMNKVKRSRQAGAQAGQRPGRRDRFIRRYDLDRDGHVGPGEMPPVLADELRPLDRDGDGWLERDELP